MAKGKKKKKAGKKKPEPETEEQMEFHIELSEEEMVEKKQTMLTHYLQDKLLKEERNSRINMHKLTEKWRIIFRQVRTEELHRDMTLFSHNFKEVLMQKDSIIKSLVCDLEEVTQQSAPALRSHMQYMEEHLESQRRRVALLKHQWTKMLEDIRADFETDKNLIMHQHKQDCLYVEEVNYAIDQYYSELESEVRQDFQSTYTDIENRNTEERNTLRVHLEEEVEVLWYQVQHTLWNYTEATEDAYAELKVQQDLHQECIDESDTLMKTLYNLQDSLIVMRSKTSCCKVDMWSTGSLQAVKDEVTLQGMNLKIEMYTSRIRNRKRLTNLISHCTFAKKKLQAAIHKGERLMRITGVCRKLENDREKIFYTISPSVEEQVLLRTHCTESISEQMAQNIQEVAELEKFWTPYNAVLHECLCLREEQARLKKQNKQLRIQLHHFMDTIHVNPLLIVTKLPRHKQPQDKARNTCPINVVNLTF